MSEKTFNCRISQKCDIEANWDRAVNFIPMAGELIIYSDMNKIKIGNGVDTVINLPFATGDGSAQIGVESHSLVISTGSIADAIGGAY